MALLVLYNGLDIVVCRDKVLDFFFNGPLSNERVFVSCSFLNKFSCTRYKKALVATATGPNGAALKFYY